MKPNIGGVIGIVSIVISLLVVAIVLITTVEMRQQGNSGTKTETATIDRTKGIDCRVRMRNAEMAIQMYNIDNGRYPGDLGEIATLTADDLRCPVTGVQYSYDSLTGKIACSCHD